jgi:hypothetical protein
MVQRPRKLSLKVQRVYLCIFPGHIKCAKIKLKVRTQNDLPFVVMVVEPGEVDGHGRSDQQE